jgi:hypothetical protein
MKHRFVVPDNLEGTPKNKSKWLFIMFIEILVMFGSWLIFIGDKLLRGQ